MREQYYVYIMTNIGNSVLYTGVTNNLMRRVYEHKNKLVKGFSLKYNLLKLVYFEESSSINSAIFREKQIKAGSRSKKIELIDSMNPQWKDLSDDFFDTPEVVSIRDRLLHSLRSFAMTDYIQRGDNEK